MVPYNCRSWCWLCSWCWTSVSCSRSQSRQELSHTAVPRNRPDGWYAHRDTRASWPVIQNKMGKFNFPSDYNLSRYLLLERFALLCPFSIYYLQPDQINMSVFFLAPCNCLVYAPVHTCVHCKITFSMVPEKHTSCITGDPVPSMSAIGSSESRLHSLTEPSAAQEARFGPSGSKYQTTK